MTTNEAKSIFERIVRIINGFVPAAQKVSVKYKDANSESGTSTIGIDNLTAVSTTYSNVNDTIIVMGSDNSGCTFKIELTRWNNEFTDQVIRHDARGIITFKEENCLQSFYNSDLIRF